MGDDVLKGVVIWDASCRQSCIFEAYLCLLREVADGQDCVVELYCRSCVTIDVVFFLFGIERVPSSFCGVLKAILTKLMLNEVLVLLDGDNVSKLHPFLDLFFTCANNIGCFRVLCIFLGIAEFKDCLEVMKNARLVASVNVEIL